MRQALQSIWTPSYDTKVAMRRDLVVIGASAGGIDALRTIVAGLPPSFPAAICVVLHVGADSPGVLDAILQRAGPLPATMVTAQTPLEAGHIYTAQPDHHLLVERGAVLVSRGPRENRFRPGIDPLFRSAAQAYGPRVIGVILTGGLDDGTAGLWAVKRLGGLAIVQDPDDALAPSMPLSALAHVKVDHVVALERIAQVLIDAVGEDLLESGGHVVPGFIATEARIAKEDASSDVDAQVLGPPSRYACPECHGVLMQVQEGKRMRFRCHTGHAYSEDALLADMDVRIEEVLWSGARGLQEKVLLLEAFAKRATEAGDLPRATVLQGKVEKARRLSVAVREATSFAPDDRASSSR